MPRVSPRAHRRVLALLVALLIGLHIDVWNHGRGGVVLGWLPWDLAYHLLWMAAATAAVWYLTFKVWPDEDA